MLPWRANSSSMDVPASNANLYVRAPASRHTCAQWYIRECYVLYTTYGIVYNTVLYCIYNKVIIMK